MNKPTAKHITAHLSDLRQTLYSRGQTPELPLTTLPDFSNKIFGLKKRQLTLVGARTSQGKSALALQFAYDLASQGHPVLLISLEMTVTAILERMFCLSKSVDNDDLIRGKFSQYESAFDEYKKDCVDINLVVADYLGRTWREIDMFLSDLKTQPEVVIVDYIQSIKSTGQSQKKDIDDYIAHFREMAIRNNFAGIICSQINRTSQDRDDKQPQLHMLKGSGYLEELPDVVMLLHWPYKYDNSKSKFEYSLHIAKNRHGRTGYVELLYIPKYYMFTDFSDMECKRLEATDKETKQDWDE